MREVDKLSSTRQIIVVWDSFSREWASHLYELPSFVFFIPANADDEETNSFFFGAPDLFLHLAELIDDLRLGNIDQELDLL